MQSFKACTFKAEGLNQQDMKGVDNVKVSSKTATK